MELNSSACCLIQVPSRTSHISISLSSTHTERCSVLFQLEVALLQCAPAQGGQNTSTSLLSSVKSPLYLTKHPSKWQAREQAPALPNQVFRGTHKPKAKPGVSSAQPLSVFHFRKPTEGKQS